APQGRPLCHPHHLSRSRGGGNNGIVGCRRRGCGVHHPRSGSGRFIPDGRRQRGPAASRPAEPDHRGAGREVRGPACREDPGGGL
ncbi:hypothetical protein, partial [Arthrobacter sp. DR-2P]